MKSILKPDRIQQIVFAGIVFLLAVFALFNPLSVASAIEDTGWLLFWSAVLVFIQGFKRSSERERQSAHVSAFITLLFGGLLINASLFVSNAIYVFAFVLIATDALRQFFMLTRLKKQKASYLPQLLAFIGNIGVLVAIIFFKGKALDWLMALTGGLRIAGMGFEILTARIGVMKEAGDDVVESLKLQDNKNVLEIAQRIEREEDSRASVDRRWNTIFIFILFFIHLGRMGFDRSTSKILSPVIALIGDLFIALIIAYVIIIPFFSLIRRPLRPFEKKAWLWAVSRPIAERKMFSFRAFMQNRLEQRMRFYIRVRKSGYSFKTAFRTGLQTGLPFAALLAAVIPVFGMSWYFDTENWASGIWDSWAAKRTDTWRSAMVEAIDKTPGAASFMIHPEGVSDTGTFSFLIVGDPGEGDASQYVLHDQIVTNASKEEVKFVVISSDVVYPDGAMKDYEKNFWLPMKGVSKPVFAIPGNHDWYDALEGFAATFYDSASANKAMQARRAADLNITAATNEKISMQIAEAARLRREYRVPTGFQQAPFFQLQTKDFAFISVETGVLRSIDDVQMDWLKQSLEASKGKFIFVLLGHPFYAAGEYQGSMNPKFLALHQLLRDYGATIAMAGDTHDLEYYIEPLKGKDTGRLMYHFVNGGGGAYLSLGAALKPKDEMPEKVWAHYPAAAPLIHKIEENTGWLKRPAWIWTKKYNGWPYSAEWLSAAFDYNKSPFFQSFMEIQVNPSKNELRLKAHGIHGPLTWNDLEYSDGVKPAEISGNAPVEWVYPLN